jgi:hypothetical protein
MNKRTLIVLVIVNAAALAVTLASILVPLWGKGASAILDAIRGLAADPVAQVIALSIIAVQLLLVAMLGRTRRQVGFPIS